MMGEELLFCRLCSCNAPAADPSPRAPRRPRRRARYTGRREGDLTALPPHRRRPRARRGAARALPSSALRFRFSVD